MARRQSPIFGCAASFDRSRALVDVRRLRLGRRQSGCVILALRQEGIGSLIVRSGCASPHMMRSTSGPLVRGTSLRSKGRCAERGRSHALAIAHCSGSLKAPQSPETKPDGRLLSRLRISYWPSSRAGCEATGCARTAAGKSSASAIERSSRHYEILSRRLCRRRLHGLGRDKQHRRAA